jgi:hypothetical protein
MNINSLYVIQRLLWILAKNLKYKDLKKLEIFHPSLNFFPVQDFLVEKWFPNREVRLNIENLLPMYIRWNLRFCCEFRESECWNFWPNFWGLISRVARFFLAQHSETGKNIPNNENILPKWTQNIPNGHTIYQHLPLQTPPKFTQLGFLVFIFIQTRIFCFDIYTN